jgi:hypothetical protein
MNLCDGRRLGVDQAHFGQGSAGRPEARSLGARLVRGDAAAVADVAVATGADQTAFYLLPAHTIEIVASIGSMLEADTDEIRNG